MLRTAAVLLSFALPTGDAPTSAERLDEARLALIEGNPALALEVLAGVDSGDATIDAERRVLRSFALWSAGRTEEALAELTTLADGDAAAGLRARFLAAHRLTALGRHEESARRTEDAVARLRRDARRREIAAVYAGVAESLLPGRARAGEEDPVRALALLRKAEELTGVDAAPFETQFDLLLVLDHLRGDAGERVRRSERLRNSAPAEGKEPERLRLLGRAHADAGDLLAAGDAWRELADRFPKDDATRLSLTEMIERFAAAPRPDDAHLDGIVAAADRLAIAFADDDATPPAQLRAAELLAAVPERRADAFARLERVVRDWPHHAAAGTATLRRSALIAQDGDVDAAITILEEFLRGRPIDAVSRAALKTIEDLVLRSADTAFERGLSARGDDRAAWFGRSRLDAHRFLDRSPAHDRVPSLLLRLARMDELEGALDAAVRGFAEVSRRFPGTDAATEAEYSIALVDAERRDRVDEALDRIDRIRGDGTFVRQARALASRLRAPALEVTADRVFTSDATPTVRVRSRNVEEVVVAMYRVRLADLFRETGSLAALDRLDVALIRPDDERRIRPEPTSPHQIVESSVPVALLERPGAAVVVARAGRLEARTAVIVTDVESLVVATLDGARVFAFDRRDGTVLDDVTTLIAVDGRVRATDDRPLPAAATVAALCESGEHVAVAAAATNGLRGPSPPEPRGWLLLDRQTARPGDLIRVIGLVREWDGDRLQVAGGDAYRVEWTDSRDGRVLAHEPVPGAVDGLFHVGYVVDPALEQSREIEARIVFDPLDAAPRVIASAACLVGAFASSGPSVEFEGMPLDVFTGQSARMHGRVLDETGEPVPNAPVAVVVGRDRPLEIRSDGAGRITIAIDEGHTRVPGDVSAVATVSGRSSSSFVRVHSRSPILTVEGTLADGIPAVAGEPYSFRFRVADELDQPLVRTVRWMLTDPAAAPAAGSAAAIDATTDENGRGEVTLAPARAGPHRVRAEIDDALGHRSWRWFDLAVAGNGDGVLVHLVPATMHPRPGAPLAVRVHSELDDGPATLLLHGDRLHAAVPIVLRRGMNALSVPLPREPGRRLRLTCAATRDFVLHLPTIDLFPRVDPILSVALDRTEYRPGETATLQLELEDAAGRPATGSATLFLVPVEAARRFEDAYAPPGERIDPWLEGNVLAIGSSGTFRPAQSTEELDGSIERALAAIDQTAASPAPLVKELELQSMVATRDLPGTLSEVSDVVGIGGGAGGAFGGRYGGRGRSKSELEQKDAGESGAPAYRPGAAWFAFGVVIAGGRGEHPIELPRTAGSYAVYAMGAIGAMERSEARPTPLVRRMITIAEPIRIDLVVPSRAVTSGAGGAGGRVRLTENDGVVRFAVLTLEGATPVRTDVRLEPFGSIELPIILERDATLVRATIGDRTVESRLAARPTESVARLAGRLDGSVSVDAPATVHLDATPIATLLRAAEAPPAGDDPLDAEMAGWRVWLAAEALLASDGDDRAAERRVALRAEAASRLRHLRAFLPLATADANVAAVALAALTRGRAAGLDAPSAEIDALAADVERRLQATRDPVDRAWLLGLVNFARPAEFAHVNRLFRDRAALPPAGLAPLAWLLADQGRVADAATVLAELEIRGAADASDGSFGVGSIPGRRAAAEEVAAVALAAARAVGRETSGIDAARRWLASRLGPHGFRAPLASILVARAFDDGNDAPARIEVDSNGSTTSIALEHRCASARVALPSGRVELRLAEGAPPLFVVASEAAGEPGGEPVREIQVERRVDRTFAVHDGRRYEIGASIVSSPSRPAVSRETSRLTPGRPGRVHVSLRFDESVPLGDHWFFEPIPAGVDVGDVHGVDQLARTDGGLWIRLIHRYERSRWRRWSYDVLPRCPGEWTFGAAWYAPARFSPPRPIVVGGTGSIHVVPLGADPDAGVAPSPDERFAVGELAFGQGDTSRARELLLPLATLALEEDPFRAVTRTLLLASVAAGDDADVVRFFETLKERDPAFVVPFDVMIDVGRAYAALGEWERARPVFLAVADATFLEEAQVVGQLEQIGRTRTAYDSMERLLSEYGPTPTVQSTRFALAQHVYYRAMDQRIGVGLSRHQESRVEQFDRAEQVLLAHLAEGADDETRGEAALTLANLLVDRGRFAVAESFAAREARLGGRFAASFLYLSAYAALGQAERDRALERANELAAITADGDVNLETLRAMGRHMAAQIHHARGDLDAARAAYEDVRGRFKDAERSLRDLDRKGLTLPLVTRAAGDDPLVLDVEHDGDAKRIDLRVYSVDLRLLYLRHRTFDRLRDILLAGVAPRSTADVPLQDRDANGRFRVPLDVPEPGAYLVSASAGELRARGMVLRTDLALSVGDDGETVRVQVKNVRRDAPQPGVVVTLVGAASSDFVTRKTDLRGICDAASLGGRVSVIAEWNGHFAFFESESPARTGAVDRGDADEPDADVTLEGAQQELLESLEKNASLWASNTNAIQTGVEVERARK